MINKIRLTKFTPLQSGSQDEKIKHLERYIEILLRELEYVLTSLATKEE